MDSPKFSAAISDIAGSIALFLEREAGQTLLSLVVMWLAIGAMDPTVRAQFAHDVGMIGIGVMGRSMGSKT